MRHDALYATDTLPTPLRRLAAYLEQSGNSVPIEEALEDCISAWIGAAEQTRQPSADCTRGYQWKALFLPESTQVRLDHGGRTYHACVRGDHIIFEGRAVSPRGMIVAIAGDGRNAWRELKLKLPGERSFRSAMSVRSAQARAAATPQQSPAQTMAGVVTAMCESLKTALAQAAQRRDEKEEFDGRLERRSRRHRRANDDAEDDWRFH